MERIGTIPNAFYDLIVFTTPTVLLALGLVVGLSGVDAVQDADPNLSALGVVGLALGILLAGYEYGRAAEAWSADVVQRPIRWLARRDWLFKNADFCGPLSREVEALGLQSIAGGRTGDKWTLYFYAFLVNEPLGSDLLKRYAWEKLSRSSALSLAILTGINMVWFVGELLGFANRVDGGFGFGSAELTGLTAVMTLGAYVEYYRRNCWNIDLLQKVTPVLLEARQFGAEPGTINLVLSSGTAAANTTSTT